MRQLAFFALIIGCSSSTSAPVTPQEDGSVEDTSVEGDAEELDTSIEPIDTGRTDTRPPTDTKPAADTYVPPDTAPATIRDVISVATGYSHTCAALADGKLRCTGENEVGQLGDGTLIRRFVPVASVGLSDVAAVAGGGKHTCVRHGGNTVSCFGANDRGQLGDGTLVGKRTATAVPGLTNVIQLAGGRNHTCALLGDSTVKCWGYANNGQVGDGGTTTRTTPVAVSGLSGVTRITLGADHSCALLADKTVKCWGDSEMLGSVSPDAKTPIAVPGLSDVRAISAGSTHTCAVVGAAPGNKVLCFGFNTFGQLGDGTLDSRVAPVQATGITDVLDVAAGSVFTCALLSSGSTRCWGSAQLGAMGDGTFAPTYGARGGTVPLTAILEMDAGGGQVCARLMDKSLWCWGDNLNGYLGDGTSTSRATPVPMRAGL